MSDPPVLSARDVSVVRGGRTVLDGVSLDVPPEAAIVVRGRSGVGKSTLVSVLGLLESPTAGSVFVEGTDAGGLPERERARLRRDAVGFVFQEFHLVPDLTARENARLPQEHAGAADPAWLAEVFGTLGIDDLADRYPATLSGGEKQRVAIARAVANRPAVVLADEPTGQLDPETTDRVLDLLAEVRSVAGAALVVASHDPQVGERFETRYRLAGGALSPA